VTLLEFEGAIPEEDQEQPREHEEPAGKVPKTSYLSARTIALPLS
jgi:hypothetical protein